MKHNEHAARYLLGLLEERKVTETCLARHAGLSRSVVSAHLAGRRVIKRKHLGHYLRLLTKPRDQLALLIAWLADDGLDPALIDTFRRLLAGGDG